MGSRDMGTSGPGLRQHEALCASGAGGHSEWHKGLPQDSVGGLSRTPLSRYHLQASACAHARLGHWGWTQAPSQPGPHQLRALELPPTGQVCGTRLQSKLQ